MKTMFPAPPFRIPKKRVRRRGRLFSAPAGSARLYVVIDPSLVHMFRFHLEAYDNLGIMTVVDRWRAVLQVRFSPHQKKEILEALEAMQQAIPLRILPLYFS